MDQASFQAFYEKTAPALRAYAIRSCGSVDVADDLVQDAFLRFLRSAPIASLSEPQMRGYLYRTVETLIVDRWRRSQRERELSPAPHDFREVHENEPEVARAFSQLDPKQRSLLWLAYVEDLDHREIAAATGVKVRSVRVLLFRARQKLAALMKNVGITSEKP
jgi:RNA polymerase sigma-70 factor (ECF subfamily)